jgi:hypothetical protein
VTDSSSTPGAWTLHGFEPKLESWCNQAHPPADAVAKARAWWPSLQHAPRQSGNLVPGQSDIRFAWVPNCALPDLGDGPRGVQCHYQISGRHVICQFFTIAVMQFPREPGRFHDS